VKNCAKNVRNSTTDGLAALAPSGFDDPRNPVTDDWTPALANCSHRLSMGDNRIHGARRLQA
jgi:hypothetical protein